MFAPIAPFPRIRFSLPKIPARWIFPLFGVISYA